MSLTLPTKTRSSRTEVRKESGIQEKNLLSDLVETVKELHNRGFGL
jgi:hypothetical protein